jgi:type VI secretion system protein
MPAPVADVWTRVEQSHDVDWGVFRDAPAAEAGPAVADPASGAWSGFLAAAGVKEASLASNPQEAAAAAGNLMRRVIAGLMVMLEARARAKAELGATGTEFRFDGNNPLKFNRGPESALLQLLNPPQRGFMGPDLAAEEAFRDLQAHQIATLAAMQQALRATLDRFSPAAIRERSKPRGLFANLFGVARNSQLWRAYEHDFEGVAQGSDEAFMDVFAKQFREAYERAAAEMRQGR